MDDILHKFELTNAQKSEVQKGNGPSLILQKPLNVELVVVGESKIELISSTTMSQEEEKRVCQQLNYLLIFGWRNLHEYLDQNFSIARPLDPRNRTLSRKPSKHFLELVCLPMFHAAYIGSKKEVCIFLYRFSCYTHSLFTGRLHGYPYTRNVLTCIYCKLEIQSILFMFFMY